MGWAVQHAAGERERRKEVMLNKGKEEGTQEVPLKGVPRSSGASSKKRACRAGGGIEHGAVKCGAGHQSSGLR